MLSTQKNYEKSADARFFGPFYKFFERFKMGKNRKNVQKIVFFPVFPYALRRFFSHLCYTQNALYLSNYV
jgi:hypothetical protein